MGSLHMDEGGVSRGKSYGCKFCGMSFSDGRVLGGHVRSHMAAAGLAGRRKKLLITPGESSEGDVGGRLRGECGGYGLRENCKKSWKFSGLNEERREHSPRGKNRCGMCDRVFHTSRALFGHMRLHPRKERRIGGKDRRVTCSNESDTSLEEILSNYKRIFLAKRKKRSVRGRSYENLPGNDLSLLSAFLAEIHRDEFEAAICLLMISRGARHLEMSDDENEIWENSSPLVSTEDEGNDSERSDGFDLGVGNKWRRVGDIDNAHVELQEVSRCVSSFLTGSNVEGKLMKYEMSFHMVSQGMEVQSRQRGVVEEIKHLVGDAVGANKVSELTVHDELGGECEKHLPPDSDTRKYLVPLKKGYKCKSCGKIFPVHQALGGHRAKFRNGSCQSAEKSAKNAVNGKDKVVQTVSVAEAALTQPDHECPTCGKVFSSGQALGGHKRRHYNKGGAARSSDGSAAMDVSCPPEVFEEENKLTSTELLA